MLKEVEIPAKETITIPRKEYEKLIGDYELIKDQLAELKRMIFGAKSERFLPSADNQLGLFTTEHTEKEPQGEVEQISYERKKKNSTEKGKAVRAVLAAHLPRVEEVIEPDDVPVGAKKIGEEVTEILEHSPARVFVRRIVRPKYALAGNEGIVTASLPTLPIPRGNGGASILAHIQVSKWVDHLPYYRQISIFKRQGVEISSSTMNSWFNATADLLEPLYHCLIRTVKDQVYLQADESPIKVLESDKKRATHTGYHWVYHAPLIKAVVFDYQGARSRSGPKAFLKDYHGALQTDGYKAYNDLFPEKPGRIILLACMAHVRRYFEKALDNDRKRAEWMLGKMQYLYILEKDLRENHIPPEHVQDLRQRKAIPVLDEMKEWLDENINFVTPKSSIGKAIGYALTLWPRIIRYTQDGHFLIDNNPIENTIRPLAVGRKNYLFAGSHKAAQQAAMMYSLLGTCRLNGVEPYTWLKEVLEVIPDHMANRLSELLPINWKKTNS